jgi:adenylate cyclase
MSMPVLKIQRLKGPPVQFELTRDEVTIGKNDPVAGIRNDIVLEDGTVSRKHARIVREGKDWCIEDCKSRNHTFVNDERIVRRRLAHGDRITIGLNSMVFETGEVTSLEPSSVDVEPKDLDRSKTIDLNYIILKQISEIVAKALNIEEFFHAVMDMVCKSIRSRKGLLLVLGEGGTYEVSIAMCGDPVYDRSSVEQVIRGKRSLIGDFSYTSLGEGSEMEAGWRSAMAVPIIRAGEVMGIIYMENDKQEGFTGNDLILLTAIANQTAAGVERVALNEKIREETLVRANLERFFSPDVAAKIARESMETGGLTILPEKVSATIVFTDIKDFTRLTDGIGPQEIAALLRDYFTLMTEVIFRHEGVLDKYIGDAIMAVFGVPLHRDDHARRAVAAALEMRDRHLEFQKSLPEKHRFEMRLGVNTGEVVAGYMGSLRRMEYTVLGKPVVIAKRLESLAEPDSVYVGKETYAQCAEQFRFERIGEVKSPKGEERIEVFKAAGLKS